MSFSALFPKDRTKALQLDVFLEKVWAGDVMLSECRNDTARVEHDLLLTCSYLLNSACTFNKVQKGISEQYVVNRSRF